MGNCGRFVQNRHKTARFQAIYKHQKHLYLSHLRHISTRVGKVVDKWELKIVGDAIAYRFQ